MVIRARDRVSAVIDRDPALIDVFVSLSPAFERLRNPAMRRVMARLVTVEQAARMAGVDVEEVVRRLNASDATETAGQAPQGGVGDAATEPPTLARIPAARRTELDVRDELRAGNEPFSLIMAARREMPAGGALGVRAIFEPVPLYAVMRRQGLGHFTEQRGPEDWLVWFFEEFDEAAPIAPSLPSCRMPEDSAPESSDDVVVLDVRGLEPPEPMMQTLAALERLPRGGTLVQLNVRVPQFLLPLLEERGFTYEVREQDRDLVRVFIRHASVEAGGHR